MLICHTQWVFTYTGQSRNTYTETVVLATGAQRVRQSVLRSDDTGLVAPSAILNRRYCVNSSVYIDTEHCIITVSLNFSILYNDGMDIVILDILLLLFIKISYK